jgi:hypothetical protein
MVAVMALVSSAAVLHGSAAWAVSGPSNLGSSRYPAPRCEPPRKSSGNAPSEQSRYQREVKEHFRCVEKYVDAGQNDIKRIQESIDAAVKGAKRY